MVIIPYAKNEKIFLAPLLELFFYVNTPQELRKYNV